MANGKENDGRPAVPANRVVGMFVLVALAVLVAIRAGIKVPTP